jgi:hypothetical protein
MYLHVLNRIPWRYLYIPGLYLLVFGVSTCILGIRFMRAQNHSRWSIFLMNHLVVSISGLVLHSTPLFLMGWYMLKDSHFANPHKMQPDWDETGKYVEDVLRNIIESVPWSYAHVPGLAMFGLSFAVIAHGMNLHQTGVGATDWGTAIRLPFYLLVAIVLNVAGLGVCMGWCLFRSLEIDGAREV